MASTFSGAALSLDSFLPKADEGRLEDVVWPSDLPGGEAAGASGGSRRTPSQRLDLQQTSGDGWGCGLSESERQNRVLQRSAAFSEAQGRHPGPGFREQERAMAPGSGREGRSIAAGSWLTLGFRPTAPEGNSAAPTTLQTLQDGSSGTNGATVHQFVASRDSAAAPLNIYGSCSTRDFSARPAIHGRGFVETVGWRPGGERSGFEAEGDFRGEIANNVSGPGFLPGLPVEGILQRRWQQQQQQQQQQRGEMVLHRTAMPACRVRSSGAPTWCPNLVSGGANKQAGHAEGRGHDATSVRSDWDLGAVSLPSSPAAAPALGCGGSSFQVLSDKGRVAFQETSRYDTPHTTAFSPGAGVHVRSSPGAIAMPDALFRDELANPECAGAGKGGRLLRGVRRGWSGTGQGGREHWRDQPLGSGQLSGRVMVGPAGEGSDAAYFSGGPLGPEGVENGLRPGSQETAIPSPTDGLGRQQLAGHEALGSGGEGQGGSLAGGFPLKLCVSQQSCTVVASDAMSCRRAGTGDVLTGQADMVRRGKGRGGPRAKEGNRKLLEAGSANKMGSPSQGGLPGTAQDDAASSLEFPSGPSALGGRAALQLAIVPLAHGFGSVADQGRGGGHGGCPAVAPSLGMGRGSAEEGGGLGWRTGDVLEMKPDGVQINGREGRWVEQVPGVRSSLPLLEGLGLVRREGASDQPADELSLARGDSQDGWPNSEHSSNGIAEEEDLHPVGEGEEDEEDEVEVEEEEEGKEVEEEEEGDVGVRASSKVVKGQANGVATESRSKRRSLAFLRSSAEVQPSKLRRREGGEEAMRGPAQCDEAEAQRLAGFHKDAWRTLRNVGLSNDEIVAALKQMPELDSEEHQGLLSKNLDLLDAYWMTGSQVRALVKAAPQALLLAGGQLERTLDLLLGCGVSRDKLGVVAGCCLKLGLEDALERKVEYLRRLGVKHVGHVLELCPRLMSVSLTTLEENVELIRDAVGAPQLARIVQQNPALLDGRNRAAEIIRFLRDCCQVKQHQLASILLKKAFVRGSSWSSLVERLVEVKRLVGEGEVSAVLQREPGILSARLDTIRRNTEHLRGLMQEEEVRLLIRKYPRILRFNWESKVQPILDFVAEMCKLAPEDVLWSGIFAYSFENAVKPRVTFLVQNNVRVLASRRNKKVGETPSDGMRTVCLSSAIMMSQSSFYKRFGNGDAGKES